MKHLLLFIRDSGQLDILDSHTDEPAARRALVRFVRQKTGTDALLDADNDDDVIPAYFASSDAFSTIVGIADDDR